MSLIAARGELVDTEAPATGGQSGELVGTVLLVDVGLDGERLLVIPEAWARRALRSYATLCSARSYRDVMADDDAAETVMGALQRSLEDLDEDVDANIDERELFARRVSEGKPFDTEEVFGFEGWRQWVPSFAESSARFFEVHAPALWSQFRVRDSGWGIDYDPTDYVAVDDEEQVLAGLRALGYEILRCPGLENQYWEPDGDLVARIDSGQWPLRPTKLER